MNQLVSAVVGLLEDSASIPSTYKKWNPFLTTIPGSMIYTSGSVVDRHTSRQVLRCKIKF